MRPIYIFLFLNSWPFYVFGQEQDKEMGGFNQIIDISRLDGTQFRLSVYAKIESENVNSSLAKVFATVSASDGPRLNKYQEITSSEWNEHLVEGQIDPNATQIAFGGYYYGIGKYYFDKFQLEIRKANGEWQLVPIANGGFEDEFLDSKEKPDKFFNKWIFGTKNGFEQTLSTSSPSEGNHALLVDGSSKTKRGHFSVINGIKIYYEFHGQGSDTILFLHGNGQEAVK